MSQTCYTESAFQFPYFNEVPTEQGGVQPFEYMPFGTANDWVGQSGDYIYQAFPAEPGNASREFAEAPDIDELDGLTEPEFPRFDQPNPESQGTHAFVYPEFTDAAPRVSTSITPEVREDDTPDAYWQPEPVDLDAIIATVASKPLASWILRANRGDVRRVVNTVQRMRHDAKKTNHTLADREIFIRYSRAVNKEPGAVNPQLYESFLILSTLMGGPGGKLPF